MVFESYGVEKQCDNHIDSRIYLLRVNKYKVHRDDEINMGLPVHTDKSFITILYQNQVSGLQVQTKDEQWISVDFLPSSFVVMAGDGMLVGLINNQFIIFLLI
jgi:isopenicillin N synthase-like dioxygenase